MTYLKKGKGTNIFQFSSITPQNPPHFPRLPRSLSPSRITQATIVSHEVNFKRTFETGFMCKVITVKLSHICFTPKSALHLNSFSTPMNFVPLLQRNFFNLTPADSKAKPGETCQSESNSKIDCVYRRITKKVRHRVIRWLRG